MYSWVDCVNGNKVYDECGVCDGDGSSCGMFLFWNFQTLTIHSRPNRMFYNYNHICLGKIYRHAKNQLGRSTYFVQKNWKKCFFKMIIKSTTLLWYVLNIIESHRKHSAAVWTDKYPVNSVENAKKWVKFWKVCKKCPKTDKLFFQVALISTGE